MRRVLALGLLIAFGFPLVLPLLAFSGEQGRSLPACCRMHGAHQCSMGTSSLPSSDPIFTGQPCPMYPAPAALMCCAGAPAASPQTLAATQPVSTPVAMPATTAGPRFRVFSNPKRGPPAFSA